MPYRSFPATIKQSRDSHRDTSTNTEAHLKNVSMIPGDSAVIPRNPPYHIDKTRKTPQDVKNATKHQNNIQTQSKMKFVLESLLCSHEQTKSFCDYHFATYIDIHRHIRCTKHKERGCLGCLTDHSRRPSSNPATHIATHRQTPRRISRMCR
jgi:hypothetical protein